MNDHFAQMVADALTEKDAKEERRKLRPWVGMVLAGMCLAVLVVAAKNAYGADQAAKYGDLTIYLYEKPCTNQDVLVRIEERVHKNYRAGKAVHPTMGVRNFCYLSLPQYETIFVLDETGEQVFLEKSAFKDLDPKIDGLKGKVSI